MKVDRARRQFNRISPTKRSWRRERNNRKNRGGVARIIITRTVPYHASLWDRTRFQRRLLGHERGRHLSVRLLRSAALRCQDQIRFRNRLAELLGAAGVRQSCPA